MSFVIMLCYINPVVLFYVPILKTIVSYIYLIFFMDHNLYKNMLGKLTTQNVLGQVNFIKNLQHLRPKLLTIFYYKS